MWRFPSAIIGSGHTERLVIANPADRDVRVTVRFALDAAAALEPESLLLPGQSVTAVDLSLVPPDVGFSMVVDRPASGGRRAPGREPGTPAGRRSGGSPRISGSRSPAREWAIVPARISATSIDELAVVSGDGHAHHVRLVRTDGARPVVVGRATVPGSGRALVDLADLVDDPSVTLLVRSDGPVVVERVSSRPGVTASHAVPR